MRAIKRIFAVLVICVVLSVVLSELWFAVFVSPSVRAARAMLDPGAPENTLPAKVTLTLDGTEAIFHRGDVAYVTLLSVLRAVNSPGAIEAAGPYPSFDGRKSCGDLAIASFSVTSHFLLARSRSNPHFLWIWLPHLHRGGYGLPMFVEDGRLKPLVQSAAVSKP